MDAVMAKARHLKARHKRVRTKIQGTATRPRLCIYKSLKHIYAQLIDDDASKTLFTVSTLGKELREKKIKTGAIDGAKVVGELIAQKALKANIKKVVFDRGGNRYHGRIKALAEAARQAGLEF